LSQSGSRKKAARKQTRGGGAAAVADADSLDGGVAFSAVVLISMGVVMSYSTTATLNLDASIPPLFAHHVSALLMGLAAAAAAAFLPTSVWRRLALPFWLFSLLLLVATHFFGVTVNGAQRWLELPALGFRFQPVELAKCATVLAVVAVIAQRDGHDELGGRRVMLSGALALPVVALLLMQPDLGNAVLLAALVALLQIVGGTKITRLILPALVGIVGIVLYILNNDYARRRVTGFMDPWERPLSEGFQLVQSFVAFGRGGLFGVGLGNGQQKLAYLPEAHTDFILSLVAEELGLIGVLVVLGGFAGLLVAGTRIATRCTDRFALLVAFGMTALLTVPAVVNASVVMGLLPTKGLTLPFLSYGRTSLIVCCFALGLLLGVARNDESPGKRGRHETGGGRWR